MESMTRRGVNRALLARQHLLARHAGSPLAMVGHLVGLQAQSPRSPYLGLWARLSGFDATVASADLAARRTARVVAMRSTLHLTTAADAHLLSGVCAPRVRQDLRVNAERRAALAGRDVEAIADAAERLLGRGPASAAAFGAELGALVDLPPAIAVATARSLLRLTQVPPRGLWDSSGPPTWCTVTGWLGPAPPDRGDELDRVVLRYLAAFGPAGPADIATWSGLTGTGAVLDRLRERLVEVRVEGERGPLLDLPDAPRPHEDTPAPARLLPDFDNVLLSHADRSRVLPTSMRPRIASRNGMPPATVLLDGLVAGGWSVVRQGGRRSVLLTPWRSWSSQETEAAVAEAHELAAFWLAGQDAVVAVA